MARPLRIEYPDAVYHVSNVGLDGQRVFPSEKYFRAFLDSLAETCSRLNVVVNGYCLLKDQYQLIVRTPEANLSRFMRQVDGLYTQQFQRLRNSDGSLFKGRYKAVLIQPEKYLLPLTRFVHTRLRGAEYKRYPWSSYGCYTDKQHVPAWLNREDALRLLKVPAGVRAAAYGRYVAAGVDAEISRFYSKKNLSSVMGDTNFRSQAGKKRLATAVRGVSRGANARWRPACRQIVSSVAREFKVSESSIYNAARGPGSKNVPRWVAMYLCQELSAETLQFIAQLFKLKRYGTVSTTVGKLKKEFGDNSKLQAATTRLINRLSKGK